MTVHLYSYVVEHDHGWAPNSQGKYCSLVYCKFSKSGTKKNLVETIQEGDWILGTGGSGPHSSGHRSIIYLMRVDEKMPFQRYLTEPRFEGRLDRTNLRLGNQFALISSLFYYFGSNAVPMADLPPPLSTAPLEKRGSAYRRDLPPSQVKQLIMWFKKTYTPGIHGVPCSSLPEWSPTVSPSRIDLQRIGRCHVSTSCSEA